MHLLTLYYEDEATSLLGIEFPAESDLQRWSPVIVESALISSSLNPNTTLERLLNKLWEIMLKLRQQSELLQEGISYEHLSKDILAGWTPQKPYVLKIDETLKRREVIVEEVMY